MNLIGIKKLLFFSFQETAELPYFLERVYSSQ